MSKEKTLAEYVRAGTEWLAWFEKPEETRKEEERNAIREREEMLKAKAIREGAEGVDFAAIALAGCNNEDQRMSIFNALRKGNPLNLSPEDFADIEAKFITPLHPETSS